MDIGRVQQILEAIRPLAVEYLELTGKPLGVTGELAEYEASRILGLRLADARTPGYDALRGVEKVQIKGRVAGIDGKRSQRLSRIKADADCDVVMLVVLDRQKLLALEIWEAPMANVRTRLAVEGSAARKRGSLSLTEFKKHCAAERVWSIASPSA